jgi:putative hydrolase of the HAD superfamily
MNKTTSLISIDFWDTLVDPRAGGEDRSRVRHQALCEIVWNHQDDLPERDIQAAVRHASESFNRIWLNDHRTPLTEELVQTILDHIGIPVTKSESQHLVRQFEESLWEGPPALAPGARQVIRTLSKTHTLALISDTMFSPGRVLREYLRRNGLLEYFDDFVFSDETGYSKPDPKAFERALTKAGAYTRDAFHIGDRMDTDVRGAKAVGMKAILFTGVVDRSATRHTQWTPDYICRSWREVQKVLTGVG